MVKVIGGIVGVFVAILGVITLVGLLSLASAYFLMLAINYVFTATFLTFVIGWLFKGTSYSSKSKS